MSSTMPQQTATRTYLTPDDELFNRSVNPPPPVCPDDLAVGFSTSQQRASAPENTSYLQQFTSSSSSSTASSSKYNIRKRPSSAAVEPLGYEMRRVDTTDSYHTILPKEERDIVAPLEPLPTYEEANRITYPPSGPGIQHTVVHGPHAVVASPDAPQPVAPTVPRIYYSRQFWCDTCRTTVEPIVTRRPGIMAIFLAILLLIFFWPLFWLPLVMPACHERRYRCPHCSHLILTSED